MRLLIQHETHYRFDQPAHHSTQYLRVTPRLDSCQTAGAWQVSTPGKPTRWTDGFGNLAHISVQSGPHDEVVVLVQGDVETFDTNGVLPADDGLPPQMFLRETPYTRIDAAIAELAAPLIERKEDEGIIAALHALMWELNQTVGYQPGCTLVESTAADALQHGFGVCQDHAHLFIACCRVMGIPARYVSGYLFTPEADQRSVASHAWAEAFVNDLGWVSFDPTNDVCATESYVRLAIGFDYASACPIRGMRKGGGVEELTVRVQVSQN